MKDIYQKMQNIDAEKSLLGSILISPDTGIAIDEANQILQPIDFYRPQHREIYSVMLELFKENKPADNVTVVEQLNIYNKPSGLRTVNGTFEVLCKDCQRKIYFTEIM